MADARAFRMGRLDHVHIRVPDRAEAAAWYAKRLGFEPVERFDFWATGFEGGPLQISADGGKTMLALFQAEREAKDGDGRDVSRQRLDGGRAVVGASCC
jgi:catechol 2,3-dioxygenase-like lactoylglutathione lyase family enzyme